MQWIECNPKIKSLYTRTIHIREIFDIVNSIAKVRRKLPVTITFEHSKGHQYRGSVYNSLSCLVWLNILAGHHAKDEAKLIIQTQCNHKKHSLSLSLYDLFVTLEHQMTMFKDKWFIDSYTAKSTNSK